MAEMQRRDDVLAPAASERRMIMNKTDELRSAFRTVELALITMLAFDVENFMFWVVWGIALILDIGIDVYAINKE